MEQDRQAE